jgi:hypothetical protein
MTKHDFQIETITDLVILIAVITSALVFFATIFTAT